MKRTVDSSAGSSTELLSNAEIADRLAALAQLLSAGKENPYKIKAYQRAAANIRGLGDSLSELVRADADLTRYTRIGEAIAATIREIVQTGTTRRLEALRSEADPHVSSLNPYPWLDPKRVLRVYKKLRISSVEELKDRLQSGEIERVLGGRIAQHIRQGLLPHHAILLYRADSLIPAVQDFLRGAREVTRAEPAGDYRRRVETIDEIFFVVETNDFRKLVERFQRYGGRTPLLISEPRHAVFDLAAGVRLRLQLADAASWGSQMIVSTGSPEHVRKLDLLITQRGSRFPTEEAFYESLGLDFVPPELREGHDEVERASTHTLPALVIPGDLRGELHAHSQSSDGSNSIEEMAEAARALGYEYLGITDHSRSLKIARGVSVEDLWSQIRMIDRLNGKLNGFRILKTSEVDILADGSLDYPDDLLRELDYTVCSIHSRFALGKQEQTERILRAMDNRYFNILGHATGRLLLKRPGYEIDIDRVIQHARASGCFFEINASPDRLDLPAIHARSAAQLGVMIAVSTDAHSTREFRLVRYGLDQARRAGLEKSSILNCQPLETLLRLFRR